MTITEIQTLLSTNPLLALAAAALAGLLVFLIARYILARGLVYLTRRSTNKTDDIVVAHLHPFRLAWLAPLIVIYVLADLAPEYQTVIERTALFFIVWVSAITINSILDAANEIYEKGKNYSGVSIEGYLDIAKLLILLVGVILSISIISGQSPLVLLTGLGALTAVLLLIFHDTLLAFVASIQLSTNDLVKEGDWLEVPGYDADGTVVNMSLHTIKIQNGDKTITVIPTHKMIETAYKNLRGMHESGGRRIKRSIDIDLRSIRFCYQELLEKLGKIDLIRDYVAQRLAKTEAFRQTIAGAIDSPLDVPQVTNLEIYRAYIRAYLKSRSDIHQEGFTFVVRDRAPGPEGLPIELYVFTKSTTFVEYEEIQAEVFNHLLAVVDYFGLHLFQQPTGLDFTRWAEAGRV